MKKNVTILLIFILSMTSCGKEFLNQPPEDQLTSEVFYKNVSQINLGIIGCYTPLQNMYNGGNLAWTLGLVSDELSIWNYVVEPVDLFNKDFNNSASWLWSIGYNNIQRCNRMIKVIKDGGFESKPSDAVLLNSYLAEAEFIRALNYFNMVRVYGAVPLVTEPFNDATQAIGIGRTPVSEIYEKVIIPGFKYAAENALVRSKMGNQLGRVTSGAGYTLLGEVYLTLKRYPEAEASLKKVIESGEYNLMPTLGQVFSTTTENNVESIFEIQYAENLGAGSLYNRWIGYNIAPFVGATASNQSINVSKALVALYKSENDLQRFNTWVTESIVNPSGLLIVDPFPRKNVTTGLGVVAQNNNFMVTRYADVILMYAEALFMQSPAKAAVALSDVNRIRTRAGMPSFTAATLTLDAILKERQLELSFEGHRWFDLLRTGRAKTVMASTLNINVPDFQLLFPIPISEIQKDPTLTQTPGY
jgi:hypothetical protein